MVRSLDHRRTCCLASCVCAVALLAAAATAADPAPASIFDKSNLAAWCIVPFDASHRGPAERAEMLKQLGFTKFAYDWRDEHIPTFEQEILELQKRRVEFFAYWCPLADNDAYRSMMGLIEKYQLHPQIWMIAPTAEADSQEQRVERSAQALLPFVEKAKQLGCQLAIYNHGGWSGEPDNMIAMAQWLRERAGTQSVGIVYNFHHGHEHLATFPGAFQRMLPYLTCVNLNGMTAGDRKFLGPHTGQDAVSALKDLRVDQKILPVGRGLEDQDVLKMIRESGYRGPLGILGHRAEVDAEQALRENLDGLKKLLPLIGEADAARTYQP